MIDDEAQDDTDWIDTYRAVLATAAIEGGRMDRRSARAAERLMLLAREQVLRVRAVKRVVREYPMTTAQLDGAIEAGQDVEPAAREIWGQNVPKTAWLTVLNEFEIEAQFDWKGGGFTGGGQNLLKWHIEMTLTGMEFAVADLRRMLPAIDWQRALEGGHLRSAPQPAPAPHVEPTSPRAGIGGREKEDRFWEAFWTAVVKLAHEDRLSKTEFKSQAALRAKILELITPGIKEDGDENPIVAVGDGKKEDPGASVLGETSIKPHVQKIWFRFIDRNAPISNHG